MNETSEGKLGVDESRSDAGRDPSGHRAFGTPVGVAEGLKRAGPIESTVVVRLPTRLEWLEERRHSIGSSDWAPVLGVGRFGGPLDVYESKVSSLKADNPSLPMRLGNHFESGILAWMGEELSIECIQQNRRCLYRKKGDPWLHATPDGFGLHIVDNGRVEEVIQPVAMEAKFVGIEQIKHWRDGVPMDIELQCQAHLWATGLQRCALGAVFSTTRAYVWWVERCELPVMIGLVCKLKKFWGDHVLRKVPPAPTEPGELDAIKRMYSEPPPADEDAPVLADEAMVHANAWLAAKDLRLSWEKAEKTHEAHLRMMMEHHKRADLPDGTELWTDARNVLRKRAKKKEKVT